MESRIKNRDSNIELLRIVSMFLIIVFHYVYKSQFQYNGLTVNTFVIKSFWFYGELGVNLFILITGYYLSNQTFSFKKVILLMFEVLFYNILLNIVGLCVGNYISISLFFPTITGVYWFVTAYVLVYFFSQYFNVLINSFDKKTYQRFLLINLIIWSIIPTIFGLLYNSTERILYYNRFIWLVFMYFVGGYIRKYDIKILKNKINCIKIAFLTFLIMLGSIFFISHFNKFFIQLGTDEVAYLWTPNNICMFILSVSIFKFFTNIKIKNNKIINKISSTTLGIYLLHDGHLTQYIWFNIFKSNQNIYSNFFLIHIILSAIIIFIVGVIIDLIRQFFEKHIIKRLIEMKYWNNVYLKLSLFYNYIINKYI